MGPQTMLWDPAAHYCPNRWGVGVQPLFKRSCTYVWGPSNEEVCLGNHFCYPGNMLSCEGRVRERWRSGLQQRGGSGGKSPTGMSLSPAEVAYITVCLRSVLYGSKTWVMTKKITDRIKATERRNLRYMAGVILADRVASDEVARRCGVKPVLTIVREGRLRRFGHVKRREGEGLLGEWWS